MTESGDYIKPEKDRYIKLSQALEVLDSCACWWAHDRMECIPAADVRPRWIPVSERLPETGVDVLVKFPQNMAVASIDIGEWVVNSGDGWCTDINLAGGEKNPTHWMPLPPAPKEESYGV